MHPHLSQEVLQLALEQKKKFLDYKVAVRDLGIVTADEIKEIFSRINSTDFALKAIERLNALYSGEFKQFCDNLSKSEFFDAHRVFSMADIKRMRDLDFCVILVITLMSTYYHRDALNKEYLQRYNDDFVDGVAIRENLEKVFKFIDECGFSEDCRVWKKTDLFTLIVELYSAIFGGQPIQLDSGTVGVRLQGFYEQVDNMFKGKLAEEDVTGEAADVFRYMKAATKATNDKYARVDRAEVIAKLLKSSVAKASLERKQKSKKK